MRLLVFARAPTPGRAKTRLARGVGVEGAAALYEAFLRDGVATAQRVGPTELHAAEEADAPWLEAAFPGLPVRVQRAGDLGTRMAAALDEVDGPALLLGSDLPTLPEGHLRRAAAALAEDTSRPVLGPSADGGFYVLGAARPLGDRLRQVPWSEARTLAETRRALGPTQTADPWYDVDVAADLALLRTDLLLRPGAAPRTRRAMEARGF
jgi:rSAM/selenodomain-associated transferase 1